MPLRHCRHRQMSGDCRHSAIIRLGKVKMASDFGLLTDDYGLLTLCALSRATWHGIPREKMCAWWAELRQSLPQKVGIKRHPATRIVSQSGLAPLSNRYSDWGGGNPYSKPTCCSASVRERSKRRSPSCTASGSIISAGQKRSVLSPAPSTSSPF